MGWQTDPIVSAAPGAAASKPWERDPIVGQAPAQPPAANPAQAMGDRRRQTTGDMLAGLVRGAGSIGATLLTPIDAGARALGVQNDFIGRTDRRQAMDQALTGMGADTGSMAFGAGKLTAEIAGTAGVGGLLARMAAAARAAPGLVTALSTSGFSSGGTGGLAGAATRALGGGVAGGVTAAAVNPEDAGTGALVGAALPGVLQAAGVAGRAVGRTFRSGEARAGEQIAKALDLQDPAAAAAQLRRAVTLVPGSQPTAAQVLRTPQASVLERVVSESAGGSALKTRYMDQNAARLASLDGVAPVDPRGLRSVQEDFGAAALDAIRGGDKAAREATRAAYQAVPQDEASLYLPQLGPIRDEFFPSGSFGPRGAVDQAVQTAQDIGTLQIPGIVPTSAGQAPMTLAQAVRRAGGLSIDDNSGVRGELAGLRGDLKNLIRTNGGVSPARMAEQMREAGYLPDEDVNTLLNMLRDEAGGSVSPSMFSDPSRSWRAAAEAAMGDAPGAQSVPKKVTLREMDALRKSIGSAQRGAALDPERATESAALTQMRQSIDDRLNQVVAGDGAADEVLPIEWANQLSEAQALKRQQVQTYRTGPQAAAFKTGADGSPMVQGGEFAPKVWGNRPGIAADIQQFRKVLDDKPQILGQFRSMITTEGAGTVTDGGKLTGRFVRWVDNSLPGLKASFEPGQVRALERISADIKRANVATAAGAAQGSSTYQNASNALSLGLLDSPLVNAAANRIPVVNNVSGPALQWMRETMRETRAKQMAGLLSDPAAAADALMASQTQGAMSQALSDPAFVQMLLRAAPAAAADR